MKFKLNWLDRFAIWIAPSWGKRRARARALATAMVRSYDATGGGRRTLGWRSSGGDADASNGPHLARLRDIARDIRRNNGWAKRGVKSIAHNTIGAGIKATALGPSKRSRKKATELWNDWSGSIGCDSAGRLPFGGLQRLAMETIVESGEVLILRRSAQSKDGLPVPLQIEVVEPDHLDTSRDGLVSTKTPNGGYTLSGIEFDARGRRVAYWLFPRHPGGRIEVAREYESVRVPAEDVIHVYYVDRPGQSRGVSWLAAAIARLQDLDEFEDAQLQQQKIAACFAAFVSDLEGIGSAVGEVDADDPELEKIEPGMIEYLPPGRDISFAAPPAIQDSGLSTRTLRNIAAGLGPTYEELTGDYSNVNFSSARMGRLAFKAHIRDWLWNMIIPQLCEGVWRWFIEEAVRFQLIRAPLKAKWTPTPLPMLDPDKEGKALKGMVRSGFMTHADAVRARGEDPEEHYAEIAETNERLDELGIVLDADPRRTTGSGQAQKGESTDETPEPAEDEKPESDKGDEESED